MNVVARITELKVIWYVILSSLSDAGPDLVVSRFSLQLYGRQMSMSYVPYG